MPPQLPGTGKITALSAALAIGGLLIACSHPTETTPAGSPSLRPPQPSSISAPPKPAVPYDISRVSKIGEKFPPGFLVTAHPAVPLSQHDIDTSIISNLATARILPPQCRVAVIPPYAEPVVGTEAAEVSASGAQGNIQVVALRSAIPVPVPKTPDGCRMGILISGSPSVAGPAEHVDPPNIAGVTTTGLKLNPEQRNPGYVFTAALDEHTSVVALGSVGADANPKQLMSDLLTGAVAAVRGQ